MDYRPRNRRGPMLGKSNRFSHGYKDAVGNRPTVNELFSRVISFDGELLIKGCWNTDKSYLYLDGASLYKELARGEGEIVRHLCGNNLCINPLHLKRGSDIENAYDEVGPFRKFAIEYLQHKIGEDYSELPEDVAILVAMARASRVIPEYNHHAYEARKDARRKYSMFYASNAAKEVSDETVEKLKILLRRVVTKFALSTFPRNILD